MKKPLSILSKVFYFITFITFFLPCFIPSCGNQAASEKPADSLEAVAMLDSSKLTNDSLKAQSIAASNDSLKITQPIDSSISESDSINRAFFILLPDGKNLSLWGYLHYNLKEGLIWLYFILYCYSMQSRFRNQSNLLIAVLSSLSLACLLVSIYLDILVVWGFWVLIISTAISVIVNWTLYSWGIKRT